MARIAAERLLSHLEQAECRADIENAANLAGLICYSHTTYLRRRHPWPTRRTPVRMGASPLLMSRCGGGVDGCILIISLAQCIGMKRTTIELHRIGTSLAGDLSTVRAGVDIVVYPNNGTDWVLGTPNGGASTTAMRWKLRESASRWWRLPVGTPYDDLLIIRNDRGNHWLWEPAADMPLTDYRAMLTAVSQFFV